MKIHSIAFLIAVPFLVLAIYTGYYVFFRDDAGMFPYLLTFVIIITIIYVFSPQIDFAWYNQYPQELNDKEKTFLTGISSFYNTLSDREKILFEQRIYVFLRSKEFKFVRKEQKELPEDMKLAIATNAIQVSLGQEKYLYNKFDRYYVYGHAFPTPDKQFLHSVEVNYEDKMVIFNMDILIKGLNVNNRVFNIGVFAFVNIFLYQHPDKYFPEIDKNLFWQKIEKVSQFNKESIINTIGYKPESEYSILFTVFFMFPEESKSEFPGLYDKFLTAFNIH
jgi:hypothetical protein